MRGAILNPVRFYSPDTLPDYLTIFPNFDNIPYGEEYFFDTKASQDTIRKHVGIMYLQFINEDNIVKSFNVYKLNESNVFVLDSSINTVNISPVGWVSNQVHKLTVDLDAGYYYLVDEDGYTSDIFQICESSEYTDELVKIKYYHSFNNYSCIFGTNYFESYFRGTLKQGEPKINTESSETDEGTLVNLKSTPQRTATLKLEGISSLYLDLVKLIFSCDIKEINGVSYSIDGDITWEEVDGGDLGTINIKLVQNIIDYCYG